MFGALETLIQFFVGLIEFLLGFRFLFRLAGANSAAPFVRWLYDTTEPLLAPFKNIFPTTRIEGAFVVEFSTLIALIIYMFIAYIFIELIVAIRNASRR